MMMQATAAAGHRVPGAGSSTAKRGWHALRNGLGGFLSFGQTWLQGSACDVPSARILDDIGMSRADFEAMRIR